MDVETKVFTIQSDLKEIPALSDAILVHLGTAQLNSNLVYDIRLATEEAVINAIRHGNKLKEELPVVVSVGCADNRISISVEDKGAGYDHVEIPDPTSEENILKGHGRGLFLIKSVMDEIHFNEAGNKIEMIKYIK